ncbi:putative ABC transporter ATP-binding protein YxlF [Candidatus Izimaplasma bacterium HR1]|jgi:ABC-2 type transport system ATP-binding protein|uniref:ABC transporter ATP-binding protein n=1 Tax=Candidatus Izimoplasma sp. HR1 TaxID=1541959 RepID=UPI0004F64159|nr:putative ABC transporter ATP-binding protein YxlF [Candidatus Izimaplasma bacterium HR1]
MIAIKTENLSKIYDKKIALDSLNIQIKQGEVYGFIGRNGAGKTTTINLMLSLIHQNEGNIYINEKLVEFKNQDYKKIIGYVPDVPAYPKYMNALEYLIYTCDMYELKNQKEKALELLDFVDLKDHKKKISAYSRGMKQRLAIAQALVHDPEIIIMDEPTSALDPIGRKDVMGIISKLKGKKTIFYSTHILEDVEKVCDRIGLLEQGKLVLEDTIENIQENYFNNRMFIETDKEAKEIYELLEELEVKNNFEMNHKGIICDVKGETTAQDILELLIKNNIKIKEFRRLNASLEDVFVRVTSEKTT